MTPKNYNRFFAQCVTKLRDKNDDFSPAAIRELLLAETADTQRWPDDEEFKNSWMGIEFYKRVKKATQRMILEAIEAALHTGMTEKVKIEPTLQIEHLMPVDWEDYWPLIIKEGTAEAQERAKKRRGETLHRIGNLTLLTRKLNPSVSNGPWAKKLKAILTGISLKTSRWSFPIHILKPKSVLCARRLRLPLSVTTTPSKGRREKVQTPELLLSILLAG